MDHASETNKVNPEQFWMPFTANRTFKAAPRLIAAAEDMYYTDVVGNKGLGCTAGLW